MRIAISGKMCSGKTTFVERIQDQRVKRVSFAEPIYTICRQYLGMTTKDRDLLIKVGQFFRSLDELVWVKALLRSSNDAVVNGHIVVVDDVRMKNEFDALRAAGFFMVRIQITPSEQRARIERLYPDTKQEHFKKTEHLTETALDEETAWDAVIDCGFTEDDVRRILNEAQAKFERTLPHLTQDTAQTQPLGLNGTEGAGVKKAE